MKTEGFEVVDRQVRPDGLAINIREATLNSRTKWFVVAYPRTRPVRTIADRDSRDAACAARDSYRGPR